jgi:HAD superfamily hydrolase (TIGR01662 family)
MPVQPNEFEKMCPQCSHSALRGEVLYFTPPHSHNPSGYWSPKKCPTCNGRGVVKDEEMIVLVVGYNAAGKTTYTQNYIDQGYHRVNRDELGGKLYDLPKVVEELHKKGTVRFVLDNTYVDIEARKSIIECAKKLKLPIKCVWLNTSFEDAQFNAVQRMVRKAGRLLDPIDFKTNKDPNLFPPVALFNYKKKFQKPTVAEGFDSVEVVEFVRKKDPAYKNKALFLDYDDTLRTVTDGDFAFPTKVSEVKILPGRKEKLDEYVKKGYRLLGASNQSGIAKGTITTQDAVDCFEETNRQLGHDIEYFFCCHSIPPVVCYCRKPHCGMGVYFIEKYKLNPSECWFIGDQTTDKTFAARCGFNFMFAEEFFK